MISNSTIVAMVRIPSALLRFLEANSREAELESKWSFEEKRHRKLEKLYWAGSLFFSFLVILGAFGSAWYAKQTYAETKRQADISQKSLLASTRAWLNVEDDQKEFEVQWRPAKPFNPDGFRLTVNVSARDNGTSPALNASLDLEFWNVAAGDPSTRDEHQSPSQVCSRQSTAMPANYGTVFMNSLYSRPAVVVVDLSAVTAVNERMPFAHQNPYRFLLCAHYRVIGDDADHLTVKAFELDKKSADPGDAASTTPTFGDPTQFLVLRKLPFGEYAD